MDYEINIPTSRNGKATFKLLLETSIKVFYEKGYHNTTIKRSEERRVGKSVG